MRPWWVCICSMDEYDNNESSVRYIFTLAKLVWSFWLDCLFARRFDCVLCILWLNCNSLIDITFIFGWTILKCSNSNFVHVYGAVSQFIWTSILFLPHFFFGNERQEGGPARVTGQFGRQAWMCVFDINWTGLKNIMDEWIVSDVIRHLNAAPANCFFTYYEFGPQRHGITA